MSNFFDEKNYNDYFNKLNNRLQATEQKSVAPIKRTTPAKRRKKGIYKTIRIRRLGCLAISLVLLIASVAVITITLSDANKNKDAISNVSSVPAQQSAESTTSEVVEEKPAAPQIFFTTDIDTAFIPETNPVKNAIFIRRSDRRVIAQRDAHKRISPASTMKIMTLLVAVEHIEDFNDTFTMTYEITDPLFKEGASVASFLNNEVINMYDLLYGLILPSGGDAAMGLAVKIAGSEEAFVELMNKKAEEFGLLNTHFTNVVGLYNKDNYSSAYDIAVILEAALNNETCRKILSTKNYTTAVTPQHPKGIPLLSTLLARVNGYNLENANITGGKTGYVTEAGYCIASFGENADRTEDYIVVTMGSATRRDSVTQQIDLYKTFIKQQAVEEQVLN